MQAGAWKPAQAVRGAVRAPQHTLRSPGQRLEKNAGGARLGRMSLRPRPSLSEDELREALREHVIYEHTMLNKLAEELIEAEAGRRNKPDDLFWNAGIESFVIHARNLAYFLCAGRLKARHVRDDDIVAEDYYPDPGQWAADALAVAPRLKELLEFGGRAAKEIAHLTYARLARTTGWNIAGINRDLFDLMARFLEKVPFQISAPALDADDETEPRTQAS